MTHKNKSEVDKKKTTTQTNLEPRMTTRKMKEDFVGARKIIRRSLF